MLVYATMKPSGVAVAIYAPASAKLSDGTVVDVDTTYPFGDSVVVTVTASKPTAVYLRIPEWATRATVNGTPAKNGTMWEGTAGAGSTKFDIAFNPAVRLEEWDGGAVSVHRGAIMYSLPISANYTVYAHHFGTDTQSNDYYLNPTSPWQFALDADPGALSRSFSFISSGYQEGAAPFNHSGWPTQIAASLRSLPSWGTALNSAAEPPKSPACTKTSPAAAACGSAEKHSLVPHGGTELRIGEMPLAYFAHAVSDDANPIQEVVV
jgi:hypothetical protein